MRPKRLAVKDLIGQPRRARRAPGAAAAGRPAKVLVDGYAMGSLSMTAYTLEAEIV